MTQIFTTLVRVYILWIWEENVSHDGSKKCSDTLELVDNYRRQGSMQLLKISTYERIWDNRNYFLLPLWCCISACWTVESIRPTGRSLRYRLSKLATVHESDSERRSTSSPLSSCCFRVSTARTLPFTLNRPS